MSWTDEELDELFQQSAEDVSFDYKDEYWSEMETMLPKRRYLDFRWLTSAFLFTGVIIMTPFYNDIEGSNSEVIAANANATGLDIVSLDVNADQQFVDRGLNLTNNYQNNKDDNYQNANRLDQNTDRKVNVNEDNSYSILASQKADKNTSSYLKVDLELQAKPSLLLVNNAKAEKVKNESDKTDNEMAKNEVVDLNMPSSLPLNDLSFDDTKSVKDGDLPELSTQRMGTRRFDFYVQGIAGVSQSETVGNTMLNYSYGLGGGVEYNLGNLYLSSGINMMTSDRNDMKLSRSSKVYGFGSDVYTTKMNYKQLYIADFGLKAGYRFGKAGRSVANLGLNASYVMTTKCNIINTQSLPAPMFGEEIVSARTVLGYTDGINRFGFKPSVGYVYQFNGGTQIGVNVGVQLRSTISDELFLNGEINRYPLDGKIYFRKSF